MKPPVKNLVLKIHPKGDVTQWFAENPALYAHMGLQGHNGADLVRPHGEDMYAIEDGEVVEVKEDAGGFGKHLRFVSDKANRRGFYHEWTYGHNSENLVKVGDKVKAGDLIARMGNTGFVVSGATPFWKSNPFAGTHLHLGLREVKKTRSNAWRYPNSKMWLSVVNYGNGYKGAIDPYPVLANLSEEEEYTRSQLLTIASLANTLLSLLRKK